MCLLGAYNIHKVTEYRLEVSWAVLMTHILNSRETIKVLNSFIQ